VLTSSRCSRVAGLRSSALAAPALGRQLHPEAAYGTMDVYSFLAVFSFAVFVGFLLFNFLSTRPPAGRSLDRWDHWDWQGQILKAVEGIGLPEAFNI